MNKNTLKANLKKIWRNLKLIFQSIKIFCAKAFEILFMKLKGIEMESWE